MGQGLPAAVKAAPYPRSSHNVPARFELPSESPLR